MNEKTTTSGDPGDEGLPAIPQTAEGAGDAADARPATPATASGSRLTAMVAWLALLLAAAALAVTGYRQLVQREEGDLAEANRDRLERLTRTLEVTGEEIAGLEKQLEDAAARELSLGRRLEQLDDEADSRLEPLETLPDRVTNLEGSMAALRGISSGLRDSWLIAEAEYYMQIANAQLNLAGNPDLAAHALRLADDKIRQLANPALTDVRRALAGELRALDALDNPDVEGLVLTLASLASVAESLPLDREVDAPAADDGEVDPELSGLDRAWASLKKTMTDVVSVRRTDEEVRPLLAPEAQYFLRANLSLQFQAARLALLRSERALFEQSLDDAAEWLSRYYDADSTAVQSALETISEVRRSAFPGDLPDISGSLRLLREFQALDAGNRAAPSGGDDRDDDAAVEDGNADDGGAAQ